MGNQHRASLRAHRRAGNRIRRLGGSDDEPTKWRNMSQNADSSWGRIVQRVAGSRAFARIAPHVVPHLDRLVHRLTGGKRLMSEGMVPTLMLTTTGRKTGELRVAPLACVPEPTGTFLVVGSNFGQAQHPAWTANLLADPRASISWQGEDVPVDAHLLDPDEKAAAWPSLLDVWPTYDRYVERSGRNLRVFRLTPR